MASIKQVAARAGVSVASVSRVLNGSKPVTSETRDLVLAAVRDLNYSIDQRARALRRQESGTLGLIVSDVGNPFFSRVIRSVEAVAYESGRSLFLCNADEDPERERFHLQAMAAQRIDGVIVLPVTNSGRSFLPLVDHDIPVVCLDRGVDDVDLDTVLVDNVAGAALAITHLTALGHQRIAIIGGLASTPGVERMTGYRQALAEARVSVDEDLVRHGDFKEEGGYSEASALLALPTRPTALFVINHPMTIGALMAIRERGLRVPADVSVVGFDDTAWAALLDPPLTTVAQPTDELGTTAARLLLERVDQGYTGPPRRVVLPPHLIERASTGPPADAATPTLPKRRIKGRGNSYASRVPPGT
jgi:DNA-binding LacI/PurR family transcriptional regulator